jgi:hypothetical protein
MPVCTASLDGARIAVIRDGEVQLCATDSLEIVARAPAPGHERAVAFCGRDVLVQSVDGARTLLTVLSTPKLAVLAQIEVDGATRLLATSNRYALVERDPSAFIVHCTPETAAFAPLLTPAAFTWAIGLDTPRFMTWGDRGGEVWDAPSRRPTARIGLEVPHDALAIGVAGQHRWLWVLTAARTLQAVRISDGRAATLSSGPVDHPVGHPVTSWLVADLGGAPAALNVVLRTSQPVQLPEGARLVIPNPATPADAFVVVVADRLSRIALSADPSRHGATTTAAGPSSAPPPRATPIRIAAPASRPSWRDELVDWARHALDGDPDRPLPYLAGSPLDDLITHAMLTEPDARILHALYAEWLEGRRDEGVATATLAAIAGADDGARAKPSRALGALGLVTRVLGRTRLVGSVGVHLDGGAPTAIELVGDERPPPLPRGTFRVARAGDESPRDGAVRLAPSLGTVAVALDDRLEEARLEAWLREAALLTSIQVGELALRPGETILQLVAPDDPDRDGAPPWWT